MASIRNSSGMCETLIINAEGLLEASCVCDDDDESVLIFLMIVCVSEDDESECVDYFDELCECVCV